MTDGCTRHAIYFVPRGTTPLGRFGADWLGWDAEAGRAAAMPEPEGLPRPRGEIVARPGRYGFHATLKAPMRLAEGETRADLGAAMAAVAAGHRRFALPLRLASLGSFLALVPRDASEALAAVAADCVTALDRFRASADAAELARRQAGGLGKVEAAHLARWGYPYVLDTYRFHMTLTEPLPGGERAATRGVLERLLAPETLTLAFDALSLCGEGRDGRFRVLERSPLAAEEAPSGAWSG